MSKRRNVNWWFVKNLATIAAIAFTFILLGIRMGRMSKSEKSKFLKVNNSIEEKKGNLSYSEGLVSRNMKIFHLNEGFIIFRIYKIEQLERLLYPKNKLWPAHSG